MNVALSHVITGQLSETVSGKTIQKVTANQNPHTFVWFAMVPQHAFQNSKDAPEMAKFLEGKTFGQCTADNISFQIDVGGRVFTCDIVPRYLQPGSKLPKTHQLCLEFDDGSLLTFTGSLGGFIHCFEEKYRYLTMDGIPVQPILSDEFTYEFFRSIVERHSEKQKSLSVKQLLATKNRIPGIDNSLLQDILWEARVNPKSKVALLEEEELQRIYQAMRTVPLEIITAGGKDVDKNIYGEYGGYHSHVSRNTLGKPCPRCNSEIIRESYLGGAVFYCPDCQEIIK